MTHTVQVLYYNDGRIWAVPSSDMPPGVRELARGIAQTMNAAWVDGPAIDEIKHGPKPKLQLAFRLEASLHSPSLDPEAQERFFELARHQAERFAERLREETGKAFQIEVQPGIEGYPGALFLRCRSWKSPILDTFRLLHGQNRYEDLKQFVASKVMLAPEQFVDPGDIAALILDDSLEKYAKAKAQERQEEKWRQLLLLETELREADDNSSTS